jgi:hypothetical protein
MEWVALSESAIRPIDIPTLRDILVMISKKGPIKIGELAKVCTDSGILGPGRKRPELSEGRINHYAAAMRCMQFVRRGRFFTLQAPYGESLVQVANFGSKELRLDERIEFSEGLFRCVTTRKLLGLFVASVAPSSYEDFVNRASPVYLSRREGIIVLSSTSHGKRMELKTPNEVMSVRWGSLPLCIDVGVIDDIKVRPSKMLSEEHSHIIFPVDLMRLWTVSDFGQMVESLITKRGDHGKLPIPELVYHGCVEARMPCASFHEMLKELYERERSRFYFDRVPGTRVEGYEKSYPRIGGQYRSVVRLIDQAS